jgi:O-antigen/teichoic acid export membrane protein
VRSLGRGIGAGLLSSGWLAVLSLVIAPVYIDLLGIESYGLIGLYTAALAIGGILDVALSATVSREIAWKQARPAEQNEIGPLLRSVEIVYWLVVSGLALILLTAGAVLAPVWVHASSLPEEQIQGALALMLLSLAIQLPSGLYSASLIGLHRQAHAAVLLAGFGTLRGVGGALLAWGVSNDIRAFFLFHVVVGLIQIAWLRWQTWSYVTTEQAGQPCFASKSLISIRQAAGAMFLITVMGIMLSQIDKLVLAFMVPLESLGHYTLAWGLASGLTIIVTPIVQGYGARFSALAAADEHRELENQINIASQMAYALVIPPAAAISLFAESILLTWIRHADVAEASAGSLALLALGTAMVACTYPLLIAMYAKKEFKPVLQVQLACMFLFFPLLLCLVDSWGIVGAALCWAVYGSGLYATYLILSASRHGKRLSFGMLNTFVSVSVASLVVIWPIRQLTGQVASHGDVLILIGLSIVIAWLLSASVCPGLRRGLSEIIKSVQISMRDRQ